MSKLLRMPAEVQALRYPWPSLVDKIPDLTSELEKRFRFGQRVSCTSKGFFLGGAIKGGSSSVWVPTSNEIFQAYCSWRALEGFEDRPPNGSLTRLESLAGDLGLSLLNSRAEPIRQGEAPLAEIYGLSHRILDGLPRLHLTRGSLRQIQFGGWGPDSAKASAYQNHRVSLYDFALRGARRTFIGLFLHELGHAHESIWGPAERAKLEAGYRVISETDTFLGVEYLLDAQSRRTYQRLAFNEFLAENYMVYVACGGRLRSFVQSLQGAAAGAWSSVYDSFARSFDGVEYA